MAARVAELMLGRLEEMINHQRGKVMQIARDRLPYLTQDDVLNPHDFPELQNDPTFNFEDGILAGFVSAQLALRACWRQHSDSE